MLPLFIDGTSASPSSVYRRKGILESIGYDTSMVWIETSLETSLKRNQQRKRHVPEEFIKEVYEKGQQLKPHYKSQFNPFFEINNDEGELTDDIILKAYKKVTGFFNTEVKNPIGTMLIEDMRKNGHKYLEDTETYDINYINKLIDSWYKR
jgi:tRNA uridine 5-carbamoylmethylation protein Kti12